MNILKNRQKMSARDLALIAVFAGFVAALGLTPKLTLPGTPVPITLQSFGVMLTGALIGWRRAGLAMLLFLGLVALFPVLPGGRGGLSAFAAPTVGYLPGFVVGAMVIGAIVETGRAIPTVMLRVIQVLTLVAALPLVLHLVRVHSFSELANVDDILLLVAVAALLLCVACVQVLVPGVKEAQNVSRTFTFALTSLAVVVGGIVVVYACGVVGLMVVLNLSFMKALAIGVVPYVPFDLVKAVLVVLIAESVHRGYPALIGHQNQTVVGAKTPIDR